MKQLYLTYAEQRRLHGMDSFGTPSRFIDEMPDELVEEVRPRIQISRPVWRHVLAAPAGFASEPEAARPACASAQRVRHGKFGDGVILNLEGQGPQARVQVNFERRARSG